jgi:putative redox protein
VETVVRSGSLKLSAHLARPDVQPGATRNGLVLCHNFPTGPRHDSSGDTYPELADRLARDTGWAVLSFNFRGTGDSEGDFSLSGWLEDLHAATGHLLAVDGVAGVWLAGFGRGASLAICAGGEDDRVRGVAAAGAAADFEDWAGDPAGFLAHARRLGVVRHAGFPPDLEAWSRELRETRPLALVGKIPPRPLLLLHGSDDDVVPLMDARTLADAADGQVELRVISGAGHGLRHDPRAVAVLMGWLERQQP